MKYEVQTQDTLKRKLSFKLPKEEVQKAFHVAYQKKQKNLELPGFRKGKVPLTQVRSLYHPEITKTVIIDLFNSSYKQALKQEKLIPAGDPKVDFSKDINEDKELSFTAELEIWPSITIAQDFIVPLSKPSITVQDKEVEQALENLRASRATLEPVKEDRVTALNDIVKVEIKELSPKPVGLDKKATLEIREEQNNTQIRGLMSGLLDMKTKQTKKITIEFSKNFHQTSQSDNSKEDSLSQKNTATEKADLEVTLLSINKKILPDLDDSFTQKFQCKDLPHLKQIIRESITQEKQHKAYKEMEEKVLTALVEKHPVPALPKKPIKEIQESLIHSATQQLKAGGKTENEINTYIEKHKEDLYKQARAFIHSHFLIETLAHHLKFSVNETEINAYLKHTKNKKNHSEEDYRQAEHSLIKQKTIQYLIDKSLSSSVAVKKP